MNAPEQLTIEHAIARADEGMRRSLERAERETPDWGDLAYRFLEGYARAHERFAGWMVVKAAANLGDFPTPPNAKAWGAVIQRAARAGVIERVGIAKDPNRHGNPIPLWGSRVYRGVA